MNFWFKIVIGAAILIAISKLFSKKKKVKSYTIEEAFKRILDEYGEHTAKTVERMFRKETNHFKSIGYKLTAGAGMEAVSKKFPYGWTSMRNIWLTNPDIMPIGLKHMTDSGGRSVDFIVFPNLYAGLKTMAEFLKSGRTAGSWYSRKPDAAAKYEADLLKIVPRFINKLTQ